MPEVGVLTHNGMNKSFSLNMMYTSLLMGHNKTLLDPLRESSNRNIARTAAKEEQVNIFFAMLGYIDVFRNGARILRRGISHLTECRFFSLLSQIIYTSSDNSL